MTAGPDDVIRSGRDPDRPPRRPAAAALAAAAAVLIGGGIAAGVLLAGGPEPHPRPARPPAAREQAAQPLLHGSPPGPDVAARTVLLLAGPRSQDNAGDDLREIRVSDVAPADLRWADALLSVTGPDSLGSNPVVQVLDPVSGGFVALLANDEGCCLPAVGDVFFIPVTARGIAAPRLIARANYLAVAPGGRDIWVQQASPPDHLPGDAWLIDEYGRRRSPVLRLGRQILLAATVRGLLTGSVLGGGAQFASTATGAAVSAGMPRDALVAAVSADDVAWQNPPCARLACPLHVTNLRTGAGAVIPLPPGTQTNGVPGAFDPAGGRIAMTLDTIGGRHQAAATHVYVIDVGTRRVTRLPGGPLPLTQAATRLGAVTANFYSFNSVSWPDGAELWIVASDPAGFQAAYWPGTGPLHVLSPQPGEIFAFAVSAAGAPPG